LLDIEKESKVKAIRFHQHGGPEVLRWDEVALPPVGPHEARVRHTAIGVDFIDIYHRSGLYARPLPSGLGMEAAGVVEAVGTRVRNLKPGDRVAYVSIGDPGAYAQERVLPAAALLKLPQGISDELAAAVMLKGMTSWYLLRQTYRLKRGETVLITAAAGGVGLILMQWARALGAKVIGVVGSEQKAELARRHGGRSILVGYEQLASRVRALNRSKGVDVVYDGVGKDSFYGGLDCLRARGMMVSFGNASGPVAPISPLELTKRGSLYLTRPTTADYVATPEAQRLAARQLFGLIGRRALRLHVGQRYRLADAAQAQRDLESRRTSGSIVLVP
jgi:NADPH:quinone reductase-like Zn-dependent oxidoreductase